jgi:gas vesicle protein
MEENGSTRIFSTGFLVGAALGATLALLYAPQPGKVTREIISEKTRDAKEKADQIVAEAREKAGHIVDEARSKIGKETQS